MSTRTLTKRELIANGAMRILLSLPSAALQRFMVDRSKNQVDPQLLAKGAVEYADALLTALEEKMP